MVKKGFQVYQDGKDISGKQVQMFILVLRNTPYMVLNYCSTLKRGGKFVEVYSLRHVVQNKI